MIPFCTSASSGMGSSGRELAELFGEAHWLDGQRFSAGASTDSLQDWIETLNITTK